MEFNPPVSERAAKELFSIISNNEKWSEGIQTLAYKELLHRKFSKDK